MRLNISRSAAARKAIRLLRHPGLKHDYAEAIAEWQSSGETAAWESVASDGLDRERRSYARQVSQPAVAVNQARLADVCERYGLGSLMVFGSVARGTAEPSSDIDLLYELQPKRQLGWEIADLEDELTEIFGRRVDLVSRNALHRRLRAAVLAEAKPLYAA